MFNKIPLQTMLTINDMTKCNLRKRTQCNTDWYSYDVKFGSKSIMATGWYKDPSDAKEEVLQMMDAWRSFGSVPQI